MGETIFAIIALGLPGFFTYVVLVKRNIHIYTKNQKDEKVMLIGLLSLTNIAVIVLLLESFNLEVMSIAGFLIIVGITLLLTFWFYPFVIRNGRRMLDEHLEKNGEKVRSNIPFMDRIHDGKPTTGGYIQCVFFDFNHCFVESGYLKYYSYHPPFYKVGDVLLYFHFTPSSLRNHLFVEDVQFPMEWWGGLW